VRQPPSNAIADQKTSSSFRLTSNAIMVLRTILN
jgi:hypothetical protein